MDWLLIGPFEKLNGKGIESVYPAEKKIKTDNSYYGRNDRIISWLSKYSFCE